MLVCYLSFRCTDSNGGNMRNIICAVLLVLAACAKKDDGKPVDPPNFSIMVLPAGFDGRTDASGRFAAILMGYTRVAIRYEGNGVFAGMLDNSSRHATPVVVTLSNKDSVVTLVDSFPYGDWKPISGSETGSARYYTVIIDIHIGKAGVSCHADVPKGDLAVGMITSCYQ